jgi:hypothetical protein
MSIAIRGHHLLCMLTYIGKGYSPEFIRNYDEIIARIGEGEEMLIVHGPDDICRPLLCETSAHCRGRSVLRRDERALSIVSNLLGRPIVVGTLLKPDQKMVDALRLAFAKGQMRKACFGCDWANLCGSVAKSDYADVKLVSCR